MGNYSYFIKKRLEKMAEFLPNKKKTSLRSKKSSNTKDSSSKSLEDVKKKTKDQKRIESEHRKKLHPSKEKLTNSEKDLDALEKRKKEIECDLCQPGINSNSYKLTELTRELSEIKFLIVKAFEKWELAQKEFVEMQKRYPLSK
jgi:ATP-binding cassette subfamily F protein 3